MGLPEVQILPCSCYWDPICASLQHHQEVLDEPWWTETWTNLCDSIRFYCLEAYASSYAHLLHIEPVLPLYNHYHQKTDCNRVLNKSRTHVKVIWLKEWILQRERMNAYFLKLWWRTWQLQIHYAPTMLQTRASIMNKSNIRKYQVWLIICRIQMTCQNGAGSITKMGHIFLWRLLNHSWSTKYIVHMWFHSMHLRHTNTKHKHIRSTEWPPCIENHKYGIIMYDHRFHSIECQWRVARFPW